MPKKSVQRVAADAKLTRRQYTDEFKAEAVQMLLDGHSAASVCERLGLPNANVLYAWKRKQQALSGPAAVTTDARVQELEAENRRLKLERDILKKALSIFGRDG